MNHEEEYAQPENQIPLRIIGAGTQSCERRHRFDELLNLLGDRLADVDVRAEARR